MLRNVAMGGNISAVLRSKGFGIAKRLHAFVAKLLLLQFQKRPDALLVTLHHLLPGAPLALHYEASGAQCWLEDYTLF